MTLLNDGVNSRNLPATVNKLAEPSLYIARPLCGWRIYNFKFRFAFLTSCRNWFSQFRF